MYFNTFCNICFYKENVIKLCHEEYSFIINILNSFIGEKEIDFIKEKVYLCTKCCENIKNYYKFKKMCHTNLVQFRQAHNKLKKKLKLNNDPDIKSKLSKFVEKHIRKENTPIQLNNFNDDTKISTTNVLNDNEIVNDVDKESLLNDNNPVYIKSEYSDESLHDLEYPNLENENHEEINVYKNLENYELPIKQELIDDISLQNDSDPLDVFSDRNNINSKLHTEIVLEINEYDSSSRERKNRQEKIQNWEADSSMITPNDPSKNLYKTGKFYQCTMCDKSFFGISNLKRHLLVHTGEKPHKCSFCEKSFALVGNLRTHLRIHTGEKPYMCNICNRTFVTTSRLKDHERVHTGERPYKCEVCNKCFSQSNGLKVHRVVHSGEKIHTCNMCDKSFTRMICLKRHKLVHTEQEVHTCTICRKSFSLLVYLKKHQRIHNRLNT